GLARTRRVGHAGTLDPMATGVLVLGIEKRTKLIGQQTLTEKTDEATIRLGLSTNTGDAEGEASERVDTGELLDHEVYQAAAKLTGAIAQVPPQVSAIKVDGKRAYKSAREGKEVALKAREVTVEQFDITAIRRGEDVDGSFVDVDATISCSSGTYIRSLARDMGVDLGTGGHLAALRRTRVGPYDLSAARTLDQLAEEFTQVSLDRAVAAAFPVRTMDQDETRRIRHGNRIAPSSSGEEGPVGLFAPDGTVIALGENRPGHMKPAVVFVPAQARPTTACAWHSRTRHVVPEERVERVGTPRRRDRGSERAAMGRAGGCARRMGALRGGDRCLRRCAPWTSGHRGDRRRAWARPGSARGRGDFRPAPPGGVARDGAAGADIGGSARGDTGRVRCRRGRGPAVHQGTVRPERGGVRSASARRPAAGLRRGRGGGLPLRTPGHRRSRYPRHLGGEVRLHCGRGPSGRRRRDHHLHPCAQPARRGCGRLGGRPPGSSTPGRG